MDEEELQKRLTDCVYFLASPLTCKKGIECEYRHSEIVRLNPRDCWFWLRGCCFNPDCAFRHPPIERIKESYFEPSNPNSGHTLPVDKTNIPCYFYSKGYCNKSDKCSFLHGSADANKSSKPASTLNNNVLCEKNLSLKTNTESTLVDNHPVSAEPAQVESESVQSESLDVSETEIEENVELFQSESDDVSNDQNSDQLTDGNIETGRWLNSSPPGFDVFVEGESERLCYEENTDCFSVRNEEIHFLDPEEYHPSYPELVYPPRKEIYEVYDRLDNKQAQLEYPPRKERYEVYDRLDNNNGHDYFGKVSEQSRKSIFYRLSFQKGNLQTTRRVHDLREHLKTRRVVVDYQVKRRYPLRHGSRGEVDFDHRNSSRKPRLHFSDSRSRRIPFRYRERNDRQESAVFTGPKTLDQIKKEKKRAIQNADLAESDNFQGPRPFSEILKNKKKFG